MYIQLVDFCNMSCGHCGFACKKKGETMKDKTFYNILKKMEDYFDFITIGGGEPTLHPNFMKYLVEIIAANVYSEEGSIFIATNGSNTKISLKLANLAKRGIISAALSRDDYHDEIDEVVVKAFTKEKTNYSDYRHDDFREIRNVTGHEIKAGRSRRGREECICEGIFIKPNGEIRGCGCEDSIVFGNINGKFEIPKDWDVNACYKDQEECVIIQGETLCIGRL